MLRPCDIHISKKFGIYMIIGYFPEQTHITVSPGGNQKDSIVTKY